MSDFVEVIVLVEGTTELRFVKEILGPVFSHQNFFLKPIILKKPGMAGGDIKFARAGNDIGLHLKQRQDTWLTLLVDYYGIRKDWPGYEESKKPPGHALKAKTICQHTALKVKEMFSDQDAGRRFIPYVSMYEFEALLFSDPEVLAEALGLKSSAIETVIVACGEPEAINDNPNSAPSKRLKMLSNRFKKTTTGIEIARSIGISRMRQACPLFDDWLNTLESLGTA